MSDAAPLRTRILSICGPALAIILVYHIVFYRPLQVRLNAERAKLKKIESSFARKANLEVVQAKLAAAQAEIISLTEQLEQAHQASSRLVSRRDLLRREYLDSRSPASAMAETLSLLRRYHLECIDSGPVVADTSNNVSESLKPVAELLGKVEAESQDENRREMRIRFRGRFQDVQSALQEMQVAPLGIFVVSLEMEVSDAHTDQRIWTLTIAV